MLVSRRRTKASQEQQQHTKNKPRGRKLEPTTTTKPVKHQPRSSFHKDNNNNNDKKKKPQKPQPAPNHPHEQYAIQEAQKAAQALVRISSIQSLADAIRQQDDPVRVAKVHRTFISIVTWGLSLIPTRTTTKQQQRDHHHQTNNHKAAVGLLEDLLEVIQRAHTLDLPLHLPLYHTVLDHVALYATQLQRVDPVQVVVDLTQYATTQESTSTSHEMAAEWLEPRLDQWWKQALEDHPQTRARVVDQVARVLQGARSVLGITHLSCNATLSLLLRLRAVVRQELSSSTHKPNHKKKGRKSSSMPSLGLQAAWIVAWLEPSLIRMLDELGRSTLIPSLDRSPMEQLLYDMLLWDQVDPQSPASQALLMSRLLQQQQQVPQSHQQIPSLVSSSSTTQQQLPQSSQPSERRTIPPLNILAESLLTRELHQVRAKELASDILLFCRLPSGLPEDEDDTYETNTSNHSNSETDTNSKTWESNNNNKTTTTTKSRSRIEFARSNTSEWGIPTQRSSGSTTSSMTSTTLSSPLWDEPSAKKQQQHSFSQYYEDDDDYYFGNSSEWDRYEDYPDIAEPVIVGNVDFRPLAYTVAYREYLTLAWMKDLEEDDDEEWMRSMASTLEDDWDDDYYDDDDDLEEDDDDDDDHDRK